MIEFKDFITYFMGKPDGPEIQPQKPKAEKEVTVNLDVDSNSPLAFEFRAFLEKFALNGPRMKDADVKNAMGEIRYLFPTRAGRLITTQMSKKEPRLMKYLQIALFYALFNAIKANPRVSVNLKKEIFLNGKEPVENQRPELKGKIADDLTKGEGGSKKKVFEKAYIDPLLLDPVLPMDKTDLTSFATNVDEGIDHFYDKIFEGEIRIGNRNYTPTQRLVLSFAYAKFFEPILNNLKAVDAECANRRLVDIPFDTISRELSKLARDEGKYILKRVIHAKDFDFKNLRNILAGLVEMVDDYNHSILPFISSLNPKRAAIAIGFDLGLKLEDIQRTEDAEGKRMAIFRSLLDLSREAARVISLVEKRKIEDVMRTRPQDPNEYRRLKVLVQFIVDLRERTRTKSDKVLTASLDFALSVLARMRSDKELASLGKSLKPIFQYILQIPDGPKDQILADPKIRDFVQKHPIVFEIAFGLAVPQKPALSEKNEKVFQAKFGAVVGILMDFLKNPKIPIDKNIRYVVLFSLENLKSYYDVKNDGKILKAFAFVNGLLRPYRDKIPRYAELAVALTKLGVEMVG